MGAARAVGDCPLFDERGDAAAYGFGGEPQKFGRFDQFERHKKFAAAVAVAAVVAVVVVALPRQNPQQRGDFFSASTARNKAASSRERASVSRQCCKKFSSNLGWFANPAAKSERSKQQASQRVSEETRCLAPSMGPTKSGAKATADIASGRSAGDTLRMPALRLTTKVSRRSAKSRVRGGIIRCARRK